MARRKAEDTSPVTTSTPPGPPRWPADSVHRCAIEKLIPSARNARTHNEAQVAQLAGSLREWGWTMPVLVDESYSIIAGHGRVLAARVLEYETVPIVIAKGWTEAQKRAYMLADNKLAMNAGWDDAMLGVEMADLKEMGFDLSLVGFSEDEQAAMFTGWTTDPEAINKTGETFDGVERRIAVMVAQGDGERAVEAINEALADAGISYAIR